MIKEAYCSFEIAKLLKEKGFNEKCKYCYAYFDDNDIRVFELSPNKNTQNLAENCYPYVTHQMVMAWLREEYKIAINIRITCKKVISYVFDIWDFEIIHPNEFVGGTIDLREQQFDFKSYEEAVEAALKYSLENLI